MPSVKGEMPILNEQIKIRFNELMVQGEQLTWASEVSLKHASERKRNTTIAVLCAVVLISGLLFGASNGVLPDFIKNNISMVTFTVVLTLGFIVMSAREQKLLFGLTDKRMILSSMKSPKADVEPFVWSIYGEDIARIEKKEIEGDPTIKLLLKPNRKTMNHMSEISLVILNGVGRADVDAVIDKMERYRSSVQTPQDQRIDRGAAISLEGEVKSMAKSLKKGHSPGQLAILGMILLVVAGWSLKINFDSRSWKTTAANISYTKIETRQPVFSIARGDFSKKYCADRIVEYSVNGKKFLDSENLALCCDTKEAAQAAASPKTVMLQYRDDKPSKYMLDRTSDIASAVCTAMIGIALILGALALKLLNPQKVLSRVGLTWFIGCGAAIGAFNMYAALEPQIKLIASRYQ